MNSRMDVAVMCQWWSSRKLFYLISCEAVY